MHLVRDDAWKERLSATDLRGGAGGSAGVRGRGREVYGLVVLVYGRGGEACVDPEVSVGHVGPDHRVAVVLARARGLGIVVSTSWAV